MRLIMHMTPERYFFFAKKENYMKFKFWTQIFKFSNFVFIKFLIYIKISVFIYKW